MSDDPAKDAIQMAVHEMLSNQLNTDDPKAVKETLNRLVQEGWSTEDAMLHLGRCVIVELFDVIQNGKPISHERYVKNLKNLPEAPLE
jgi:hypothetical protein